MRRLQNHTGTIFHAKSESGYYVFGTVLLDIEFLIRKRAPPYGTPIDMPNSVLVEMYDYVDIQPRLKDGAVAIRGAFVDRDSLDDAWGVCGRKTITPRDISFPQGLIGHVHDRGECAFLWGEIQVPIPIKASWLYSNKTYLSRHSTGSWPEKVLGTLGYLEKVPEQFRHGANLIRTDLRYNPLRRVIEKHLKFDCNDTYYEVQRSLGMDIGRLLDVT